MAGQDHLRPIGPVEAYVRPAEYRDHFVRLGGIRERIAADLPLATCRRVLDLACGYGYFTAAVAARFPDVEVIGIDLLGRDVERTLATARRRGLARRVAAIRMDAVDLGFPDRSFDAVVNFGGLEDIHMTRGRAGVGAAFREVARVLRSGGRFCFAALPVDQLRTPAQRLEASVFSYACGATWLTTAGYAALLEAAGPRFATTRPYTTGLKLTPGQAKQEIRFTCQRAPALYGIRARTFGEVWRRYGPAIERHGLGQFSRMVLFRTGKGGT